MRRIVFLVAFLNLASFVYAENLPQPSGWVNDFAGVISQEYKDKIGSLIGELEQKTSTEIAVVTIDSISPYGEIEYARLLFDNWKPGKKGKDNGVLVLLAIKERRWRIETGYGVEGILPDSRCGEIGRNYMVPYFKEGKYSEGLYNGLLKIAQILSAGEIGAQPVTGETNNSNNSDWLVFFIIIGFFIFISILSTLQRSRYGGYSRGGGYNGGGFGTGGFGGGGFGGGGGGGFGGGGGGGGGAGGGF